MPPCFRCKRYPSWFTRNLQDLFDCGGNKRDGYVGGKKVRPEPVEELPTIEKNYGQIGPRWNAQYGCNLTEVTEPSGTFPCRELVLTRFIREGVSTPNIAAISFWNIPRKTQIDFLLEFRKQKGLLRLINQHREFYGGASDPASMAKVFLKKREHMSYEEWSVLLLSGVLYLKTIRESDSQESACYATEGIASAALLCRAEMKEGKLGRGRMSSICDADLDNIPDAYDDYPFRPHKVPQQRLQDILNGRTQQDDMYLCTRETDPVPHNSGLLSATRLVEQEDGYRYYETTTKIHLVADQEKNMAAINEFGQRINPAINSLPLSAGKIPIRLRIEIQRNSHSAWHNIFVTKLSPQTHGRYFHLIFPTYNTQFMSTDVGRRTIAHEFGHIAFGLDDRYVPHNLCEGFEPKRMRFLTHILHNISLAASEELGNNLMGAIHMTWPLHDVVASLAMTRSNRCSPVTNSNFDNEYSGVSALHLFFGEESDTLAVLDQYGGNNFLVARIRQLIAGMRNASWQQVSQAYQSMMTFAKFVRESNLEDLQQNPPSLFDILMLSHFFTLAGTEFHHKPPSEFYYYLFYALYSKLPAESLEPFYARLTTGSWLNRSNKKHREVPVSGIGIVRAVQLLAKHIDVAGHDAATYSKDLARGLLTELADLSPYEYENYLVRSNLKLEDKLEFYSMCCKIFDSDWNSATGSETTFKYIAIFRHGLDDLSEYKDHYIERSWLRSKLHRTRWSLLAALRTARGWTIPKPTGTQKRRRGR